jgi:hypothetical protein
VARRWAGGRLSDSEVSIVLIVHQSDVRRGRGMAQQRCWPGLVSHDASLPPHDRETVTRPGQIGVALSTNRDVGYDTGGGRRTTSYLRWLGDLQWHSPIVWSRVRDHTEALEIYPDPALLTSVGGGHLDPERPWPVDRCVVGRHVRGRAASADPAVTRLLVAGHARPGRDCPSRRPPSR